jgi:2-polyprenyl-6-methoxyphenol hydroxylase-like FAD-dependent oxidoreductase
MSNPIMKQAIVIGAGMGGLAAAKAVAPHFERVIVFDRDALPDIRSPRAGTPQARHTHGLLPGGQRALERLFPGIERFDCGWRRSIDPDCARRTPAVWNDRGEIPSFAAAYRA